MSDLETPVGGRCPHGHEREEDCLSCKRNRELAAPTGSEEIHKFEMPLEELKVRLQLSMVHAALSDAWRDLLEWEQLAANHRSALKAEGKDPDREPYCPTNAAIARTIDVRKSVGLALGELRKLLLPQNNEDRRQSPPSD